MSKETSYEDIVVYLNKEGICDLIISTKEDFINEKKSQRKSGLYVKLKYKCADCGEEILRSLACLKAITNKDKCNECSRKNISESKREEFEDVIFSNCKQKGVVVERVYYENHIPYIDGICSCGEKINHIWYVAIKNSEQYLCDECNKKRLNKKFKTDWNTVVNLFKENQCVLLSKESDFSNYKSKLKYIATCGHFHETSLGSFKKSKYHMCKECSVIMNSGKFAYNWNGGYDNERTRFRKTFEYKNFVRQVLKRDNYTCLCCITKSGDLNVHHLDGYNWCEEKRTDINNGITLCKKCHEDFHLLYGRGNNTKEQFFEWCDNQIESGLKGENNEYREA